KIFSGSPKKNAAWRSLSNMKVGTRPGLVMTCQNANSSASRLSCHTHRLPARGLMKFHMSSGDLLQLLLVALEDLVAQHGPDGGVQFKEARCGLDLGDVARAWHVDGEVAHDVAGRPRRHDHHAVAQGDGFVE